MFCTKCGGRLPDNSNFCTSCGAKIDYAVETASQNVMTKDQMEMQIQMQQLKMQQQQMNMQAEQLRLQQEQFKAMVRCPKCGSTSISSNKKGYGVVKGGLGAVVGTAIAPGIGTAIGAGFGNKGSKNILCTCMNCGYRFKPGKAKRK